MQNTGPLLNRFWGLLLFLCLLFTTGFVLFTGSYPQGYFSLPVNRAIQLSGTFGELRSNHFHTGLDIKSRDGSVGENVYAAGEGFISRIAVKTNGYGNVIYVDHPNGYTTVYAHLDHFTPEVAAYVKAMQYAQHSFEVNLHPSQDQFPVAKQELVGYLGSSGGSTGPHLHFEIRKTSDQLPINPLLFGIPLNDSRNPSMRTLKVYHLGPGLRETGDRIYSLLNPAPGEYRLRDTLTESAWRVGFALKVYDLMGRSSNLNGIYSLSLEVDDLPQYSFEMNSVPFSQARYLNAHIDYGELVHGHGFYNRCFRLPGNVLDIYSVEHDQGIVQLFEKQPRKVEITARDFEGNTSHLEFYVRRDSVIAEPVTPPYQYAVGFLSSAEIQTDGLRVSFEPHTFYQNEQLQYAQTEPTDKYPFAPVYQITPDDIPVQRYFDMAIRAAAIPDSLMSKAFIAKITDRGKMVSWGGQADGDMIHANVRALGSFSVGIDTIAPDIIPITFRQNMTGMSRMRFRISDNQAIDGEANDLSYEGTVDGNWILMEYNGRYLTYWFDEHVSPGQHEFKLTVRDDRGNTSVFERPFSR